MTGFFITGTDTDIGKTLVAGALMLALQQRGFAVAPMKPVAAGTISVNGVDINEDVALLTELAGRHFPLHCVNPYCFREAIAPHIAAETHIRAISTTCAGQNSSDRHPLSEITAMAARRRSMV